MSFAVGNSVAIPITTDTSITTAFTNTAGKILYVGVWNQTDLITGVTYGGVAMTKIGASVQIPTSFFLQLYRLILPPTGSNNIVVTASGSVLMGGAAVSYTSPTIPAIDVSGSNTASSTTSISKALTTTQNNNEWIVAWAMNNDGATLTAGANTTLRQIADDDGRAIFDTNGAVSVGSTTLNVNTGATNTSAIIAAAMYETGVVPGGSGGGFLLNFI